MSTPTTDHAGVTSRGSATKLLCPASTEVKTARARQSNPSFDNETFWILLCPTSLLETELSADPFSRRQSLIIVFHFSSLAGPVLTPTSPRPADQAAATSSPAATKLLCRKWTEVMTARAVLGKPSCTHESSCILQYPTLLRKTELSADP